MGQIGLAAAPNLVGYIVAWLVIGFGMGAGLFDAAFATLGRLFGYGARSAITTLTLFGGFASTICWPISVFLRAEIGWRGACLSYAAFQLLIALPLYLASFCPETRQTKLPDLLRRSRRLRFVKAIPISASWLFSQPPSHSQP
ncbi:MULTISPECIES: hypothetical protein [unclassified Mesorhizobium]|uniref:hypothetical protein n=1 Tax=unclassified Mesorhizobium TaxID=325217 RepID=UPI0028833932|nr:hypothetical protein [Mesorhizobium sp. P13.3]